MSSPNFPTAFIALALGGLSLAALATSQGTSGGTSTMNPEELAEAPATVCSLTFDKINGGALLSATVEPEATMTGTYALTVTRKSGGNRSSIRQGGAFVAPGGETTVLSMSSFNSTQGVEAKLTITANGKVIDCTYPPYPFDS
jgi:hypothetical protein